MPRPSIDRSFLIRALVSASLIALPFIFFHSAFTGNVILAPGDGWTQNFGVRVLIGQMIAAGEWPLWNPYIFGGTPLLASIYPGALYPPNWLFAILNPATAMNLVVVTTYHIALIGTYLFARRAGNSRPASLIAAIAFAFGGYMVSHLGHTSRIAAAAWLPWIMLAIEELYLTARWRWVVLGSCFIALQLYAGEPQMNCYTIIIAGLYWLFSVTVRNDRKILRGRFVISSAAMAICGLMLSLVQYLPSRELLKNGERLEIPFEYFAGGSFPPVHIFTFIFPFFFGGGLRPPFMMGYWGREGLVETCGYVGLVTILLCFTAIWASSRTRMIAFWAGTTLLALVLAFGVYLPFGIDNLLHRIPVYSLFRVQARHMFDFTFCAGILAAFGLTALSQSELKSRRRTGFRAGITFLAFVLITAIAYSLFSPRFFADIPHPAEAGMLLRAESIVPLALAVCSVAALAVFAYRASSWTALLFPLLLFADLKMVANSYEWTMAMRAETVGRMTDSPAVKLIKARESDLHAFRIASYSRSPFSNKYAALDYPNVSIARGLQSVNGYDALRLINFSKLAGDMTIEGLMSDTSVFSPDHRGLDLLNVKYLLMDRLNVIDPSTGVVIDGIRFDDGHFGLTLTPESRHVEMQQGGARCSVLALITNMSNSGILNDGTPILGITLRGRNGEIVKQDLVAGRDTAEWSFDRADVRATINHRRAPIAESFNADGFQAHRYLARIEFPLMEVTEITLDYLPKSGSIEISRASLFDHSTSISSPVEKLTFDSARWRILDSSSGVDVFERVDARPRVWLVRRAEVMTAALVLGSIKSGRLPDGSAFNPAETVLFATEDFGGRKIELPETGDTSGSEVKVTKYGPHRIELDARNSQPSFLVLSEIYYRGWEARIDGNRAPVERVDYVLRGLRLPPGEHKVEFIFLAHSFRQGALYGGIGLLLLAAGGVWWRRSQRSTAA